MNHNLKKYVFKTNIGTIYQMFWITYDMIKISPNIELDFDNRKMDTIVSISNANLLTSEIKFIFNEHQIEFESITEAV